MLVITNGEREMGKPFSADCLSVAGLIGSISGEFFVGRWTGECRIESIDWDSAVFCAEEDSAGTPVTITPSERWQIELEVRRLLKDLPDGHLIDRVTLRQSYGNQQAVLDCVAIT